jgi:chromosome partitioning protein
MTRVISITNQKGGVGKTTTAINLGAALAERQRRVLLIDLDPQGSLTTHSGIRPDDLACTIWDLLRTAAQEDQGAADTADIQQLLQDMWVKPPALLQELLSTAIIERPNANSFDLIGANLAMSAADMDLAATAARERHLAAIIPWLSDSYDFVLVDCQPALSVLTYNALTAAQELLIPLEASYLSQQGMNQLFRTVANVKRRLNPTLKVLGIVITKVDTRTRHSRDVVDQVSKALAGSIPIFDTAIPTNVDLADASAAGVSVLDYAPRSRGADAYRDLAGEIDRG